MATDGEPEPGRDVPPRKLSEELAQLQIMFAERAVTLREVVAVLHGHAYLLLLVLLALPFCTPIPLPGLSTPFGLVLAFIGMRLTLGLKPWLPGRLLTTSLPPGFFARLIHFTQKIVGLLEKMLRPRCTVLIHTEALWRLHAFAIFLAGLALLLPLPIPFTNTFPAWAVLLIACGLLERDGLFIIAGHLVFAAGVAYFILLGDAAQHFYETAKTWLLG